MIIGIVLILFGAVGFVLSVYLRATVKSPVLTTEDGKQVDTRGLSVQQILNLVFTYFMILHVMFILVGLNFVL